MGRRPPKKPWLPSRCSCGVRLLATAIRKHPKQAERAGRLAAFMCCHRPPAGCTWHVQLALDMPSAPSLWHAVQLTSCRAIHIKYQLQSLESLWQHPGPQARRRQQVEPEAPALLPPRSERRLQPLHMPLRAPFGCQAACRCRSVVDSVHKRCRTALAWQGVSTAGTNKLRLRGLAAAPPIPAAAGRPLARQPGRVQLWMAAAQHRAAAAAAHPEANRGCRMVVLRERGEHLDTFQLLPLLLS